MLRRAKFVGAVAIAAWAVLSIGGCDRGSPSTASSNIARSSANATATVANTHLLAVLSPSSRQAFTSARVPLLLPTSPTWLGAAVVTSGDAWSAISIRDEELTVSIHATDNHLPAPANEPIAPRPHRVRGVGATITLNEGVRAIAWEEHGIAYTLEIECYRHDSDPRCTGEDFARDTVEALVRVSGSAP